MSPRGRIFEVDALAFSLTLWRWPFVENRAADIAAHWARRHAVQPALFNGRILLMHERPVLIEASERTLTGAYFETGYADYLAFRDLGFPEPDVGNCFSMAALRSADGAFILGEMAEHTANAGVSYFPAGTPDLSDVRGAKVDLEANLVRELKEEAGIALTEVEPQPRWVVVDAWPRVACFRTLGLRSSAEAAAARIERFIAEERQPEFSRTHVVRKIEDALALRCPPFVLDFLRYAFA